MASQDVRWRQLRRRGVPGGVFARLAGALVVLGLSIGAVFPFFVVLLGVPARYALVPSFVASCLTAGVVLAGSCWAVARRVVGRRLADLTEQLVVVASDLRSARGAGWDAGRLRAARLVVSSTDDLGRTAQAFNALLATVEEEHRFRVLVEAAADTTFLVDPERRVSFASVSVQRLLGLPPEAVVGRRLEELVDDRDAPLVLAVLAAGGHLPGGPPSLLIRVPVAGGGTGYLDMACTDHRDDQAIGALVVTARDVTQRHELEVELAHRATHDALTGLPNRTQLVELGAAHLAAHPAGGAGGRLVVLMLDLDRFKEVNDTLGHSYGDRLLEQIGPRLRAHLRPDDLLARLGGDEFAVLLPGADAADGLVAARRLAAALQDPFRVAELELEVGVSIGVAVRGGTDSPLDGADARPDTIEDLLRRADVAMYTAKQLQTGVEEYRASNDRHDRSRLVLLTEFRRALAEDQLVLHFQPKVSLVDGRVTGVEALVRWQHPRRGLLHPGDFLPVVESTGLVEDLTEVVLRLGLARSAAWWSAGRELELAVNLSARSLHDTTLPARVTALLDEAGVPPRLLRLEVTETAVMADPSTAAAVLGQLRDLGVGLSLDDYGTGWSSLSYLRHLPFDELKVDGGFVGGMVDSADDQAIVRSAIELGHSLGMSVVAEGIEQGSAATALAGLACDTGQGFFLGRPAPAEEFEAWWGAHRTGSPVPTAG